LLIQFDDPLGDLFTQMLGKRRFPGSGDFPQQLIGQVVDHVVLDASSGVVTQHKIGGLTAVAFQCSDASIQCGHGGCIRAAVKLAINP
jgi:hypothetical protein